MLYDSNYMTFWKRHNYRDSERISGVVGREDLIGRKQEIWGVV